jgi:hypothetical protein
LNDDIACEIAIIFAFRQEMTQEEINEGRPRVKSQRLLLDTKAICGTPFAVN